LSWGRASGQASKIQKGGRPIKYNTIQGQEKTGEKPIQVSRKTFPLRKKTSLRQPLIKHNVKITEGSEGLHASKLKIKKP